MGPSLMLTPRSTLMHHLTHTPGPGPSPRSTEGASSGQQARARAHALHRGAALVGLLDGHERIDLRDVDLEGLVLLHDDAAARHAVDDDLERRLEAHVAHVARLVRLRGQALPVGVVGELARRGALVDRRVAEAKREQVLAAPGTTVSTMKADESMSGQSTGMPRVASAEPHRPGAISRHLRPSRRSVALIWWISAAMLCVCAASKRSGLT